MERKCKCRQPSCKCNASSHIKTEQGLAYTPSQMNELRQRGIPISTMMVADNLFYDGDSSGDMSYDPVLHRDVNEINAWEMERSAKKNLMRAHKQDVELYDDK